VPCRCGGTTKFKEHASRGFVTVVGEIRVLRRSMQCPGCGVAQVPWDDWAGTCKGHLTSGARRLACLVGASWSFDEASRNLAELCGLSVSDQTIRRVCDEQGTKAAAWMEDSDAAARPLRDAPGNAEFYVDGTMISTREGWREMRLCIFAKRESGDGVDPVSWDDVRRRKLPLVNSMLAMCRIASSDQMGPWWARHAERLGVAEGCELSVLADGAKWIGSQVDTSLPLAERTVDIYHVKEHVHACGQVLYGAKAPEAGPWADAETMRLIQSGAMAFIARLDLGAEERSGEPQRAAMRGLADYLRPNVNALEYARRLRRGLPIGSGMVEGGCKTIIGRRIKCNSARWLPDRAERLVSLCCLRYGSQWDRFWADKAAA